MIICFIYKKHQVNKYKNNNSNKMNNTNMMDNNMNIMNMMNQMNMINQMNMNMMNNTNMINMNRINMMNQMNMMNNMNNMNMVSNQNTINNAIARLKKEFYLCSNDEELKGLGCIFMFETNNYFAWRVTLKGPAETPYEGGIFTIRIIFPWNYPIRGPEFKFMNHIYHLNVDFTDQTKLGHICLNFLNEWTTTGKVVEKPCYGVKQALIDIFCLFYNQNVGSAYNEIIAQEYQSNPNQFKSKAKSYTQQYAKAPIFN